MKFYIFILSLYLSGCGLFYTESSCNYEVISKEQILNRNIEQVGYFLSNDHFINFSVSDGDTLNDEIFKNLYYYSPKNQRAILISSADLSDGIYGDTLMFYKKPNSEKQVFIWKMEGEYWSYLKIFLYYNQDVVFVGDLSLGLHCKNCDAFNFPNQNISVVESDDKLIIMFKGSVIYRGAEFKNIPYHSVNINSNNMKILFEENKVKVSY